MSGETTLTYNGVTLRNCLTRSFRQEAVYEQSDTDLLYYRYTIGVTGYLTISDFGSQGSSAAQLGVQAPNLTPSLPPVAQMIAPQQHQTIRVALMTPRQSMKYTVGGFDLLKANQIGPRNNASSMTNADVKNGPHPRNLSITQITGSNVMRIEYEIECCLVECDEQGRVTANDTGILNNRWSLVDAIDDNYYTTRTISGRMETANGRVNVNALRKWVVPRLQAGFKRQSMTFTVTQDARILEYTITDREVAFACPAPATSWQVRHTETARNARLSETSLHVVLKGPRDVDKQKMIRIAIALIESRVASMNQLVNAGNADASVVITSFMIVDSFGDQDNSIEVLCQAERTIDKMVAGALTKSIGKPVTKAELAAVSPNYDPSRSPGARKGDPIYVTGPIPISSAWSAFMQTPCDGANHGIEDAEIPDPPQKATSQRDDYSLSGTVVSSLPEETTPNYLSPDHKKYIYTYWKAESKYQQDTNRIPLPIAGQAYKATPKTPTQKVIRVALPHFLRIFRVQGQRVGKEPSLPKPKDSYSFLNGTAVLLRSVITPVSPERTIGGQEIYTTTAEYVYALTAPPADTDPLPISFNPWETAAVATHKTTPQFAYSQENP